MRLAHALLEAGFAVGVLDEAAETNARVELGDRVSYERDLNTVLGSYDVVVSAFGGAKFADLEPSRARVIDGLGRQIGPIPAETLIVADPVRTDKAMSPGVGRE
jgi:hypothetical protein